MRALREAVLGLSMDFPFARPMVNSGRLSLPCTYLDTPLSTPDAEPFDDGLVPGSPAVDAPVTHGATEGWLLPLLGRQRFTLLGFADPEDAPRLAVDLLGAAHAAGYAMAVVLVVTGPVAPHHLPGDVVVVDDNTGLARERYAARPGTVYVLRPDQHVCARMRTARAADIRAAVERALGRAMVSARPGQTPAQSGTAS